MVLGVIFSIVEWIRRFLYIIHQKATKSNLLLMEGKSVVKGFFLAELHILQRRSFHTALNEI
jgi:hypothetical protein